MDKNFAIRIESKIDGLFDAWEKYYPTYEEAAEAKQEFEDDGYVVSEILDIRV